MQIQNYGVSLFDYMDSPEKGDEALQRLVDGQNATISENNIGSNLKGLSDTLKLGEVANPLALMESDLSSISLQTINNMIGYNLRPVADDLQQMAARLGITEEITIELQDDKWQVKGLNPEPTDPAEEVDENPTTSQLDKNMQKLQDYLDRNQGLQNKLDQLNKLSEFYEFAQTQNNAAALKEADVGEESLVSFLSSSREYLYGLNSFSLSEDNFAITSRGAAELLYEQAKENFGVDDKE